jgi:hypothetical protein
MLPACFRGHGVFIYEARPTIEKFATVDGVAKALQSAGMTHAWIRLHDYRMAPEPEGPTKALVASLGAAGIALAGWGFVAGNAPEEEADTAAKLMHKYGLAHYVADIEQDEHDSQWTAKKIPAFLTRLRAALTQDAQILVSSYPYIKDKHPELMRAAAPYVDGFAPQIYWHNYPAAYMLEHSNLPPQPSRPYSASDLRSPAAYADLCLDWWREVTEGKPLLMTGQSYWERSFSKADAEKNLTRFLSDFTGWSRITGLNWWHLGHKVNLPDNGAMTQPMFQAIAGAKINLKPFCGVWPT